MFGAIRAREPQRSVTVIEQDEHEDDGEVQKVAMDVLQNQRKFLLAAIALARLAHRARNRIRPESLVVRAAIVVASEAEESGKWQNEHRCRERKDRWPPRRRRREQQRRVH